jgi:hypothetical protein
MKKENRDIGKIIVRRMERRGRGVESVGIRRKGAARYLYIRNVIGKDECMR